MRIRWSPVKVMEATEKIEGHINQIIKPLERARKAARDAKEISNLPEYMKWRLDTFLGEIDRVIGGAYYNPDGVLKSKVEGIRNTVPQDALEEERNAIASRLL
jgi:hypothetical protein